MMDNSSLLHSNNHPDVNGVNTSNTRHWDNFNNNDDFLHEISISTPDFIYLIDLNDGNIIYINKKAEELFGYDEHYINEKGLNFLNELVHPDDRKDRNLILQTAIDGTMIEAELRLKMKDGTFHLFRICDRVIKKKFGAAIWQTIGFGVDITEQKNEASNTDRIKAFFEFSEAGIMVLRPVKSADNNIIDFQIIHVNQIAEGFFGKKIISNTLHSDNFKDHEINGHLDKYLEVLASKKPIVLKIPYFTTNGQLFSQTVVLLDDGDIAITFDNGNRQKNAKVTFNEQSKLLKGIVTVIPDILFVLDLNTKKILYANKQITKILGYTDEQVSAVNSILNIIHDDDKDTVNKHLDNMQTAADGEVREIEYKMLHADGSLHWFLDRNIIFKRNTKGQPTVIIGIIRDITLLKNQENKIINSSEVLEQLEKLAQTQINELNHTIQIKNRRIESANTEIKAFNTLATTTYSLTLQKLYTSMEYLITNDARNLSNEGRANIRRAQSSIQKMKLMTEDMVNLSKLHTLDTQLTTINLNSLLAEVISSMTDKVKATKAIIKYAEMPVISGYYTLVSLLFHHLLDNSIKFHKPDTQVIVNIAYKTDEINSIAYHVISITDNGIGFEQKNAQELFTMFYRNNDINYKGSGVGLAVCKKIMDIHNGFITAKSDIKNETIFSCYFPIT